MAAISVLPFFLLCNELTLNDAEAELVHQATTETVN